MSGSNTARAVRSTRRVLRTVRGMPTSDGAGVKLRRVIGQPDLPELDPFLMLDEFGTDSPDDYIAGFPEHPHRGFETVTYILDSAPAPGGPLWPVNHNCRSVTIS